MNHEAIYLLLTDKVFVQIILVKLLRLILGDLDDEFLSFPAKDSIIFVSLYQISVYFVNNFKGQ